MRHHTHRLALGEIVLHNGRPVAIWGVTWTDGDVPLYSAVDGYGTSVDFYEDECVQIRPCRRGICLKHLQWR